MLQHFPVSEFIPGIHGMDIKIYGVNFTNCQINSVTTIPGLYIKEDITPYMHMFTMHISYYMHQLKEKGLSLRLFSTSSIEKKNYNQVKLFFRETTMGGAIKKFKKLFSRKKGSVFWVTTEEIQVIEELDFLLLDTPPETVNFLRAYKKNAGDAQKFLGTIKILHIFYYSIA
ncbi:hypothetical protein C1646_772261 [Rhizophagus diaphanus]|nr:hypothetical protein C1646_772261 [Rhizophagus diaphanus] [Rhizophagus sp. MUCL 43196]